MTTALKQRFRNESLRRIILKKDLPRHKNSLIILFFFFLLFSDYRDMYESQKAGKSTLLDWTPVYIVLFIN